MSFNRNRSTAIVEFLFGFVELCFYALLLLTIPYLTGLGACKVMQWGVNYFILKWLIGLAIVVGLIIIVILSFILGERRRNMN